MSSENKQATDYDIKIPISYHIEELLLRIMIVCSFCAAVSLFLLPFSEDIIQYLWNSHIPESDKNRPVLYAPLSLFMTRIKVISLFAVSIGFPLLIYQIYEFMKPALYDVERKYFKISVIASSGLSVLGILVGQFVVLRVLFGYTTSYSQAAADIAFGLQETVGLMLILVIYLIIIFQMPILIMLAILMNVVSIDWIKSRRILFWIVFFVVAFIFSPDPTGMAPFIIGVIMILLFELSLLASGYLPESKRR